MSTDKVDALEVWASAAMELVMHVAELHARNSMYNTKILHDAWNAKQQELRAYLRTQPEGYRMVPVEPTPAILACIELEWIANGSARKNYASLIAAAQEGK